MRSRVEFMLRLMPSAVLASFVLVALPSVQPPASVPATFDTTPRPTILDPLRTRHPRLLVLDDDLPEIRRRLAGDVHVRRWRDRLRRLAVRMLDEPVIQSTSAQSRPTESRSALHRIATLAGLFLLDGDPRLLARARAEMRAVAALPDWNSSHRPALAEMTAAMALGYDWLYADLTLEERESFQTALITKGLAPGVDAIDAPSFWAAQGHTPWSEVYLGGLTLGALAVAEHAPALAVAVLDAVQRPVFRSHLARFSPDGGDVEGPGYWGDSTRYVAFLLSALDTALGNDFGLGQTDGLAASGQFRVYSIGPSGKQFNYADAVEEPASAPQMLWMAARYNRPEYAAHERALLARASNVPTIFHLLWSARGPGREASSPPVSTRFRGTDVAVLGSDWRDVHGSWVALKGGTNGASLGHLDLGSFVIDALGQRWAVDLGADDAEPSDHLGPIRWTRFRVRTESHNTLLVDGRNQDATAKAPIVEFSDDSYRAFAVTDLSAAYRPSLTRARRGIALIDGRDVLMQDEIDGAGAADVVWQMATRAQVTIVGRDVILRQNGQTAFVRVIEPSGARLLVDPAIAPRSQVDQPDAMMIRVVPLVRNASLRFALWFSTGDRPAPPVTPLDSWTQPPAPAGQ